MTNPDWSAERAEIERVAQEYREKGYQIIIEPSAAETPDFIREYKPDIIARSDKECVVIEVKRRLNPTDRQGLRAIAREVEKRPGWRFALVSPGPPQDSFLEESLQLETNLADKPRVAALVKEAQELRLSGHYQGALLLSWAAAEAAMRFAALRNSLELRHSDTWTLMRELVSTGLINREHYSALVKIFRIRSAIAHGFAPQKRLGFNRAVNFLIGVTKQLLDYPSSELK